MLHTLQIQCPSILQPVTNLSLHEQTHPSFIPPPLSAPIVENVLMLTLGRESEYATLPNNHEECSSVEFEPLGERFKMTGTELGTRCIDHGSNSKLAT